MIFWHNNLSEIRHATWPQRFVWLNVVLFIVGALVVSKLASATFTLLALAGIALLVCERWPKDLAPVEKWLLLAFALYFVIGVVSYNLGIKTRLGWEILFRDIRFLFAIPVYLILRRYSPPKWLFWIALALGAFATLGVSLADYLDKSGGWRATGGTISIIFGHLCAGMALACLGGAILSHGLSRRQMLFFGFLSATVAAILSGTRGAPISLLIVGFLAFITWYRNLGSKQKIISWSVICTVLFITFYQDNLRSRFSEAILEVRNYISNRNAVLNIPEFIDAGCVNNYALMKLMGNQVITQGSGKLAFSIVEDPHLTQTAYSGSCQTNYVFKVENTSSQYGTWFYTAPRSVTPESLCRAELLVRGRGAFEITGRPESREAFDLPGYRKLVLRCGAAVDHRLTGLLPAGSQFYYVPIARYPGEYSLFYADTSVGARFAMWGAAWDIFLIHPVTGAGPGAFPQAATKLVLSGKAPGITAWFDHAHNDYLTMLADRGLAGLAALLLLYGAPFWLFVQALRQTANRPEPVAGLLLVGGFMLSGLTETLFNHSLVITYYAVFISLLAVLSRQPPAKEPS